MQENRYIVLGDGITREGIEKQNNDDTKDFIEGHVDNDTIDDDDKGK